MSEVTEAVELTPFSSTEGPFNRSPLDIPGILSGDFWGELRVFLAVAKGRSINRAADILGMNTKTVARHVKRLQDVMCAPLIVQTTQGVLLTKGGQELAERLAELDYRLFKISEDVRIAENDEDASVRIGITDALGSFFVAPSIASFRERNPNIRIEIRSLINANDFRENLVDVMLSSLPMMGDDVLTEHCGMIHFNPMASTSYIARKGMPTMTNIEDHEFVQSPFYETEFWSAWKTVAGRGRTVAVTDSTISYGTMTVNGVGVGLMASFMTVHKGLVPLNLGVQVSAPIFIVCMKEAVVNPPIRVVRNWMIDLFSPKNPWFAEEIAFKPPPTPYDAGLRRIFSV